MPPDDQDQLLKLDENVGAPANVIPQGPFKGVSFRRDRGKWQTRIFVSKDVGVNVGTFETEIEAARAYDAASFYVFGK